MRGHIVCGLLKVVQGHSFPEGKIQTNKVFRVREKIFSYIR